MLEGTDRLLKRHEEAWAKLWESDIIVEGDLQAQKDIRFAIYHLYSFARKGTAYSLSPYGACQGLGYNGHVFWDTELWMYPPLLMFNLKLQNRFWNIALKDWMLPNKMLLLMVMMEPCIPGNQREMVLKIRRFGH